jgi:hypothetical protein
MCRSPTALVYAVNGKGHNISSRLREESVMMLRSPYRMIGIHPAGVVAAFVFLSALPARADVVGDWNAIMVRTLYSRWVAAHNPAELSRMAAIVQTSVYDAVNGLERRYEPFHVDLEAPHNASAEAAAIQAAYRALVTLVPFEQPSLDADRAASLAALAHNGNGQHAKLERGIEWGETVAQAILDWRARDGITPNPPPFLGGDAVGQWRPTPPAFLPGLQPQFATMVPWALDTPSQFRPAGSPPLNGAEHALDYNETRVLGEAQSTLRTAEETLVAQFWNSVPPTLPFNRLAVQFATAQHFALVDTARVLALLTTAMADSVLACWDAKYFYQTWRPVTEIPIADEDQNPNIVPQTNWAPLLVTPPFPEYPSLHSSQSGAAATVIAAFFGASTPFSVTSEGMPGVTRSFAGPAAALDEIADARVFGGIHYRTACQHGQALGETVAGFVIDHILQPPGNGHHHGHGGQTFQHRATPDIGRRGLTSFP